VGAGQALAAAGSLRAGGIALRARCRLLLGGAVLGALAASLSH